MHSLAFSNLMDFIEIGGNQAYIDITKCTREQMAALSSLEVIEMPPVHEVVDGEVRAREVIKYRIRLHDKKPILEMLAKRENMLEPDRVDVNVTHNLSEYDRMEMAKKVAFMLRKASEEQKRAADQARMGKAQAVITDQTK